MGERTKNTKSLGRLPTLPCACADLRRAARVVTRLYNRELRSARIEITQFTLLMALDRTGEIPQGELGKLLALDSTTLTRMLELLKRRGWVQAKEGNDDRRYRIYRLTGSGRDKLHHALPRWQRAQERLRSALGEEMAGELAAVLSRVAQVSVT